MAQFRHAAIAAALLAGTVAAGAQTTIITEEPRTRTVVTTEPLQLSPGQRQTIYRTIRRERVVTAPQATVEYRVGTRVPTGVQLYSVPEAVAVEVPAIKSYKYMVVNDQVVLIDPATGQVVAELAE